MPELPEVEAIARSARKHAIGRRIKKIEIPRPKDGYFGGYNVLEAKDSIELPDGSKVDNKDGHLGRITDVNRVGKWIMIELDWPEDTVSESGDDRIQVHNAMTGYLDWEHDPWTFHYVEGDREAGTDDVQVALTMDDGSKLRFHDLRRFGRMYYFPRVPEEGPELMALPLMRPGRPVIDLPKFAELVLADRRPVKVVLMDQKVIAGVGNIYANEGCHLAGVDPRTRGTDVQAERIPLLLESLRCVVEHSVPEIRYDWLRVYRCSSCGSCGGRVEVEKVAGRGTYICNCQGG